MLLAAPAGAKIPASLYKPSNCDRIVPAPGTPSTSATTGFRHSVERPRTPRAPKQSRCRRSTAATATSAFPRRRRAPPLSRERTRVGTSRSTSTSPCRPLPRRGAATRCWSSCTAAAAATRRAGRRPAFDGADAGGEKWHYNNAWFAARGYVVLNYTARGFVDGSEHGSTGQTELDSRSYEINDYQSLACQVLGAVGKFNPITGRKLAVNPNRIVTTGGSYGGGFSWLALTDPKWTCTGDTGAGQAACHWRRPLPSTGGPTSLYSLVPTGTHLQEPGSLPAFNGCDSGPRKLDGSPCPSPVTPVGIPKKSILAALYASGKTGIPPGTNHTTFPPKIDNAFTCLQGAYPPESNPACATTLQTVLPEFLRERSAYYQNLFFQNIASNPNYRIPVFNAATFTDTLFPAIREPHDAEPAAKRGPQLSDPGLPRRLPALHPEQGQRVGGHLSVRYRPSPLLRGPRRLSERQLQRQLAEPRSRGCDHPPQPLHRPLREAARRRQPAAAHLQRHGRASDLPAERRRPAGGRAGPDVHRPNLRAACAQHPRLEPHRDPGDHVERAAQSSRRELGPGRQPRRQRRQVPSRDPAGGVGRRRVHERPARAPARR